MFCLSVCECVPLRLVGGGRERRRETDSFALSETLEKADKVISIWFVMNHKTLTQHDTRQTLHTDTGYDQTLRGPLHAESSIHCMLILLNEFLSSFSSTFYLNSAINIGPIWAYFNGPASATIEQIKIWYCLYSILLCFVHVSLLVLQRCSPLWYLGSTLQPFYCICERYRECVNVKICFGTLVWGTLNSDTDIGKSIQMCCTPLQH